MVSKIELLIEKIKIDIKNGDFESAVTTLSNDKTLFFKFNPIATLELHIKTLIELNDIRTAFKELTFYRDLPYVSQEVEEKMKELEEVLFRHVEKSFDDNRRLIENVERKILSDRFEEVYDAFSLIKSKGLVSTFKNQIKVALEKDFGRNTTYNLMLGLENELKDETYNIVYYGEPYLFQAKDFFKIEVSEAFRLFAKELDKFNKDTTVFQFALNLSFQKMIEYFPRQIESEDIPLLALYYVENVNSLLNPSFDKAAFYKTYKINNEMIKYINKKYHLGMYQG